MAIGDPMLLVYAGASRRLTYQCPTPLTPQQMLLRLLENRPTLDWTCLWGSRLSFLRAIWINRGSFAWHQMETYSLPKVGPDAFGCWGPLTEAVKWVSMKFLPPAWICPLASPFSPMAIVPNGSMWPTQCASGTAMVISKPAQSRKWSYQNCHRVVTSPATLPFRLIIRNVCFRRIRIQWRGIDD